MGTSTEALRALEWNRFLNLAQAEARTEPGKALVLDLEDPQNWANDLASAQSRQQETQEVSALLDRDSLWGPLSGLVDPSAILESLGKGSVLEVSDLSNLRRWLHAIDSWVRTPRDEIAGDRVLRAIESIADPGEPLRTLDRLLTPEGELSERASPRLATLYSEIRSLKREISSVLDSVLKTYSQQGVLQENFSDVRDGRYVVPVKISHQSEIDGIIYEASASRQTVFVEPREVGALNNRLRQRQNDLIQEIFVVLQEASSRIRPFAGQIASACEILTHWDAVQARARFGLNFGAKAITVVADRTFLLHHTVHPLLAWSLPPAQIVRNEIDFGDPVRSLLLTGPNTGGKTVLLKTLGLAGICARTGFPFPGSDHPTVPFFDSFFADVGDSQSIEQHLSSFSGHIMRFRDILANMTPQSLVLIDELNTATDPEEGAALGRAFLETVMAKGAIVVTTTHDPHLKALAVSDRRILNASMAFDESSRTPTYRMILGVPGRSRAIETAERLGMPADVLTLARKYLSREHIEFESMLARLENDIKTAENSRIEAVSALRDAEKLKKEWAERTQTGLADMLDRTRQKLRRTLEQAQSEMRTSVQKVNELQNRRAVNDARGGLTDAFNDASARIEAALEEEADLAELLKVKKASQAPAEPAAVSLAVGVKVRVPKWKSTGQVVEIQGDRIKVAMGAIQMTLTSKDVEPLSAAEQPSLSRPAGGRGRPVDTTPEPGGKIDMRGKRFEEAMAELQLYIDQAYRSGMAEVTIVHGLGTGALREGTRKMLSKLPYVKEFRDGGAGMGGSGATLVEFER